MRIFFVGDNQAGANWGRGASLALLRLLSSRFEISGRVAGDFFVLDQAPVGYVGGALPAACDPLARWVLVHRYRHRVVSWGARLLQLLGARDFVSEDPVRSVDRLVANRSRHPALARIYQQARDADLMVIDGDGDIIFSTPPRRETLFLLAAMELGLRLGKPVFLVNSMISDCPLSGRNAQTLATTARLLARCAAVALRDPESLAYVQTEMPGVNCRCIPDSLFSWSPLLADALPPGNGDFLLPYPEQDGLWGTLDFSRPYLCVGGGALAASQPEKSVPAYVRLVETLRGLGCPVYLTENDTPDAFLRQVAAATGAGLVPAHTSILMAGAVLAHARLFVSGRYHPSILAALGGTPCIFLGSHAHKMRSLARLLDYPDAGEFHATPDPAGVAAIAARARDYLEQGDALRARIRAVAKRRCDEAAGLPAYIEQHAGQPGPASGRAPEPPAPGRPGPVRRAS